MRRLLSMQHQFRLNPLYSTDYSFRDIYMIATAAENDESAFEKATMVCKAG